MGKSSSEAMRALDLGTLLFLLLTMHSSLVGAQSDSTESSDASVMVGMLLALFPDKNSADSSDSEYGPENISVIGLEDTVEASTVEQQIQTHLESQNTQALIDIFTDYFLIVDIEKSSEETLVLTVPERVSAEQELALLIKNNDVENVKTLLENEEIDVNLAVNVDGYFAFTPITVAAAYKNMEIMELLVSEGADPNIAGDEGVLTAFGHAVKDHNLAMTRLLLDAGASVDFDHHLPAREPLSLWAAEIPDLSLIRLLVDLGVDPSLAGTQGWTPLSEAIRLGNVEMAYYLVDKSDPRLLTDAENSTGYNNRFDGQYFPRSNALHLARHFLNAEDNQQLIDQILQRTEVLGGKPAVSLLQLRSFASAASLAYEQSDVKRAIDERQHALNVVDVTDFDSATSEDLINQGLSMLVNLHELSVIAGYSFGEEYREQARHLAAFNDRFSKWHDMLDVIEAAKENNPAALIDEWQTTHGDPTQEGWNYDMLLNWSDELGNDAEQARVLEAINAYRSKSIFK